MMDRFQHEQEAFQSLANLYEQARICRGLFETAGAPLPDGLKRFLGVTANGTGEGAKNGAGTVTAPPKPKTPKEATDEWVWIPTAEAMAQSLVLAVMRDNVGPMRPRDIIEQVQKYSADIGATVIYNIGPRLKGKLIQTTEEGWALIKPDQVPMLYSGNLWGPTAVFSVQEVASHRRLAILHILKSFDTGLENLQITEMLRKCPWVKAPVNKDLVKMDIVDLSKEQKIRRRGNTRKWELTQKD